MRTISLAAAALAVLAAVAPASAQTAAPLRPVPRLEVTGQGSIDRTPDRVVVSLSVITNDDNASRATSENNTAYNAVVARLRALGLDQSAIKTTGYNVSYNPRPANPPIMQPQFVIRYGYVVTRSVSVTSDRTDQAGPIIDAAVSGGATTVGGVSFTLRDNRGAYRTALAAAVADAEAQAQALAAAAHVRIVRLMTISAGSYAPISRPVTIGRVMAAGVAAPPVPTIVEPGDLTVSASVTVTYEVAP
ncbi:MAG TPA: SIMPL domain-containing protein [Candidatus Elarobacter sp.]|jgi:hypothetical protein|nr:SIMPL domain-containing protein [Candidatus Elarobacter sp.]